MAGKKLIGPRLFGVAGRTAGSDAEFRYSAANEGSGLTWDAAPVGHDLTSPSTVVPGTLMTYAGLKNDTPRADLIQCLATLK